MGEPVFMLLFLAYCLGVGYTIPKFAKYVPSRDERKKAKAAKREAKRRQKRRERIAKLDERDEERREYEAARQKELQDLERARMAREAAEAKIIERQEQIARTGGGYSNSFSQAAMSMDRAAEEELEELRRREEELAMVVAMEGGGGLLLATEGGAIEEIPWENQVNPIRRQKMEEDWEVVMSWLGRHLVDALDVRRDELDVAALARYISFNLPCDARMRQAATSHRLDPAENCKYINGCKKTLKGGKALPKRPQEGMRSVEGAGEGAA